MPEQKLNGSVQLSRNDLTRSLSKIACSSHHEGAEATFENVLKAALVTVAASQTAVAIDFGRKGFKHDAASGQGEFEFPLAVAEGFDLGDRLFMDALYEGLYDEGFLEMPQIAWAGIRMMATA